MKTLYFVSEWNGHPIAGHLYIKKNNKVVLYTGTKEKTVSTSFPFWIHTDEGNLMEVTESERRETLDEGQFYNPITKDTCRCIKGNWFKEGEIPLFSQNFRLERLNLEDDFQLFTIGDFVANDGEVVEARCKPLVIRSVPYTLRAPGFLDHPKYFVFSREDFIVPEEDIDIFFETKMAFKATGLNSSGLRKYYPGLQIIPNDIRLSCGTFNVLDLSTGMVYDFILANEMVYALYEHLSTTQDTDVFTYAKAVAKRTPDLPMKLRISYNKCKKRVVWYVNDLAVFEITNPGIPLPEQELLVLNGEDFKDRVVLSDTLSVGFGTFTLLDFFPPDQAYEMIGQSFTIDNGNLRKVRPLTDLGSVYHEKLPSLFGEKVPQTEFVYEGPRQQDGQGGILSVYNIKVGLEKEDTDKTYIVETPGVKHHQPSVGTHHWKSK